LSLLSIKILFILNYILYLSKLVFTETYISGVKNRLNYQNKAIYCKFKSDLSIVSDVKSYKLAEYFQLPQLVLHE